MTQQLASVARNGAAMRLRPLALAVAFGVATAVVTLLFGGAMGAMGSMMGSGPGGWGGWMHGSIGGGPGVGGGWMMGGGGLGFGIAGLVWGFLSGAIAGGITAWVYNAMVRRAE
ncbi:MAG: hypothetical protein ACLPKB_22185 [Xanthobacteraceae bacterium]